MRGTVSCEPMRSGGCLCHRVQCLGQHHRTRLCFVTCCSAATGKANEGLATIPHTGIAVLNPHFPHPFREQRLTALAEAGCLGTDGCGCLLLLGHPIASSSPRGRRCCGPAEPQGPAGGAASPQMQRASPIPPPLSPSSFGALLCLPLLLAASGQAEGGGLLPLGT